MSDQDDQDAFLFSGRNSPILQIPAFCTQCGHMFISSLFGMQDTVGTTFGNCTDVCPICGGVAEIPDGTYDFEETIHMVTGPTASRAKMQRYLEVLRNLQNTNASEYVAMQTLKLEAPELVRAIESLHESNRWKVVQNFLMPLLIALLTYLLTQSGSSDRTPSAQEIGEAMERAIREVLKD